MDLFQISSKSPFIKVSLMLELYNKSRNSKTIKKSIPFTMPELIIKAKHKGIRSRVYPIYENWLDIGRNEDLSKVSQLF